MNAPVSLTHLLLYEPVSECFQFDPRARCFFVTLGGDPAYTVAQEKEGKLRRMIMGDTEWSPEKPCGQWEQSLQGRYATKDKPAAELQVMKGQAF